MNENSDLFSAIRELIAEKLSLGNVSEDTDMLGEGVLDSVTLVQLILNLERRFQVRIELSQLDIDDLRSVRSIARFLTTLQADGMQEHRELAHTGSGSS